MNFLVSENAIAIHLHVLPLDHVSTHECIESLKDSTIHIATATQDSDIYNNNALMLLLPNPRLNSLVFK